MPDTLIKTVTFISQDIPPLKAGKYKLVAHQTVNQTAPNDFTAERTFAVAGNRFQLAGDDIVSTFPPANANGEFSGVLPHVVLRRPALPWQRNSMRSKPKTPWLAVLLFAASEMPEIKTGAAADVIAAGVTITVNGARVTATGKMPKGVVSYPDIIPLDYGQTPDSPCSFIDVPVATFNNIAPSANDLCYLAHIREVDTYDTVDDTEPSRQWAVVLGNRIPAANNEVYGVLVSLENMSDYLPDDTGKPSPKLPVGATTIRLLTYANWRFFANNLNEGFQNLAENLNKDAGGRLGVTTIRIDSLAASKQAVKQAIDAEASQLSPADGDALVRNALAQGYVPLDHHLRDGGDTVSWYRGPLLPYGGASTFVKVPASGPDALLRYDPHTGMFDTSYAAAWQLGQLLALESASYATALYQWKKTQAKDLVTKDRQGFLAANLCQGAGGGAVFTSLISPRPALTAESSAMPEVITNFIGQLRLLVGVPFAWMAPDERMLPPESFRLFSLDPNWIEALVDGAFSIGRATEAELKADREPHKMLRSASAVKARMRRMNDRRPLLHAESSDKDALKTVTGVLLRSQLVRGWPRLNINGYSSSKELPKLRMTRLSPDVMICLFDGAVSTVTIHEAPEQLHCGVERTLEGDATTTLRKVSGADAGRQLTDNKGQPMTVVVPLRKDGQTLQVANAARSAHTRLTKLTDFSKEFSAFTSAEFALEFIKGAVEVEFVVRD
ncbi:MAG: hypothetical protein U1F76_14355 [Candidatus Competibacteraceae bacterium]